MVIPLVCIDKAEFSDALFKTALQKTRNGHVNSLIEKEQNRAQNRCIFYSDRLVFARLFHVQSGLNFSGNSHCRMNIPLKSNFKGMLWYNLPQILPQIICGFFCHKLFEIRLKGLWRKTPDNTPHIQHAAF